MRHSTFLEVDLKLLASNLEKVRNLAPRSEILPMVKANAYGNGLEEISTFLVRECAIKMLGCASLGEALMIKKLNLKDIRTIVFSDTEVGSEFSTNYLENNLIPVLHQKSDLDFIMTNSAFDHLPLYLKLNTGMNRLGLDEEDLAPYMDEFKKRGIQHLMTHFACSYFPSKPGDRTQKQLGKFHQIKKNLEAAGVRIEATSVANSGAIEQKIGLEETHVRPGLMIYGPYSTSADHWEGHQISSFQTKILKTMTLKKGTPVGYGNHVLAEDAYLAIIPVGYGDGLTTFSSGVGVTVEGYKGEIFARVNMDMAFLKFPLEAKDKIKAGTLVKIWNHDNKVITDMATAMKTIPYQLMCALSTRVPRIYKR